MRTDPGLQERSRIISAAAMAVPRETHRCLSYRVAAALCRLSRLIAGSTVFRFLYRSVSAD